MSNNLPKIHRIPAFKGYKYLQKKFESHPESNSDECTIDAIDGGIEW